MANTISNMNNTIDSRDVIERIEELEIIINDADTEESANSEEVAEAREELRILLALQEEAEGYSSDWEYGSQLIRRSYFEEAMDEMVEECYALPKDMPFWMSIKLDYDALEQDYTSVDFDGVEYLIQ